MIDYDKLTSGQLVQSGRELFQVSTVYPGRVTAQLVYPVPPRTTVRIFVKDSAEAMFDEPTEAIVKKFERAYSRSL